MYGLLKYTRSLKKNFPADWKNPLSWIDHSESMTYMMKGDSRKPASIASYKIAGDCDGFPRIDISTASGFCVGIVDNGANLLKPRFTIELDNEDLVLSDMGSWDPLKGKIFYYKKENNLYTKSVLFSAKNIKAEDPRILVTDRPNQLLLGPDKLVYIGTPTAILRFNPKAQSILSSLEIVISNLPANGLHALKAMTFNNKKQLFVNVGSVTNVCEKFGVFGQKMKSCPESEDLVAGQGQIRMYQMQENGTFSKNFKVFAKGTRNSMALLFDAQSETLLQAENGRDSIDKHSKSLADDDFPHEEINIISEGKHYGWPYCFDDNKNNPEWINVICKNYTAPYLMLPPHAAPLSMLKHSGLNFPAWYKNRLIMGLHGYAQFGHRIVTYLRDETGQPTGVPLSLVYDWKTEENKPGTPVGLFEMKDGSILITEDNNKKVLRLFYNETEGDGKAVREIDGVNEEGKTDNDEENRKLKLQEVMRNPSSAPAFAKFQAKIIDNHCISCHGNEAAPGIQLKKYDYLGNEKKLLELNKENELLGRISANPGYRTMPPAGFVTQAEQDEAIALVKAWIIERQGNKVQKK